MEKTSEAFMPGCPATAAIIQSSGNKYKNSGKKRKLSDTEIISSGSVRKKKANVQDLHNTVWNINYLPEEILIKIFRYLRQDEFGHIARVCKKWYELTRYPILWKKVDVLFKQRKGSQNEIAVNFIELLPTCLTHLKLDFRLKFWKDDLEFEEFCIRLSGKCPSLKALILHCAQSSVSLQSAIDLCCQYFQNLEVLSIHKSTFTRRSLKVEYRDQNHIVSKIRVLDFYCNEGLVYSSKLSFSKMSSLKNLRLAVMSIHEDTLFDDDTFPWDNLKVLNLRGDWMLGSRTFLTLQNRALMLTELYLCDTNLKDSDFSFSSSAFPQLKTICLRYCPYVTCEGIVSLTCSCQSLKNIYVNVKVAYSYVRHPFVLANKCKLKIIKTIPRCQHYENVNYLSE